MTPRQPARCALSTRLVILLLSTILLKSTRAVFFAPKQLVLPFIRGGSTDVIETTDDDEDEDGDVELTEEEEEEAAKRMQALKKYRMEQQMLMQLRSAILSEALAKRGIPMVTMMDVSTAEGDKPPEIVDWDCALSTEEDPKSCLFSFDAEPNTKVVAPLGTTQWISLAALNRLRRIDPTKVEPMWHSKYAILNSWFSESSEYSVLQHAGPRGLSLSLFLDNGMVLKALLTISALLAFTIFSPVIDFTINRFLVSSMVWMRWPQWARIVHAALPLKLLLAQMAWKALAKGFGKIEERVKDVLVEVECANLEATMPLTVGPGSEPFENSDNFEEMEVEDDDSADEED